MLLPFGKKVSYETYEENKNKWNGMFQVDAIFLGNSSGEATYVDFFVRPSVSHLSLRASLELRSTVGLMWAIVFVLFLFASFFSKSFLLYSSVSILSFTTLRRISTHFGYRNARSPFSKWGSGEKREMINGNLDQGSYCFRESGIHTYFRLSPYDLDKC